jgi:hypothetical protein
MNSVAANAVAVLLIVPLLAVLGTIAGRLLAVFDNWLRGSRTRDRARRRNSKQCPICGQDKEGH